eukprot:366372-Chlamydomonas_euryale.AAC.5
MLAPVACVCGGRSTPTRFGRGGGGGVWQRNGEVFFERQHTPVPFRPNLERVSGIGLFVLARLHRPAGDVFVLPSLAAVAACAA